MSRNNAKSREKVNRNGRNFKEEAEGLAEGNCDLVNIHVIKGKSCLSPYLSKSVSREESRNPLANGLLSIFSFVIWIKRQHNVTVISDQNNTTPMLSNYKSVSILLNSKVLQVFVKFTQSSRNNMRRVQVLIHIGLSKIIWGSLS
jgi:hypothetical protein